MNSEFEAGGLGSVSRIDANQITAFEDGSRWLPILGRGTVLRVTPPEVDA